MAGEEDDKRLSTLLSGSGSNIGASTIVDKKEKKKKKKKSDNDLLSAKGINVQAASRGELRGIVPYAFLSFCLSFLSFFQICMHSTFSKMICDVISYFYVDWMNFRRFSCGFRCWALRGTCRYLRTSCT